MAEKQPENSGDSQPQSNPPSTNADIGIGGSVGGNVTVGNSNVINYYYQQVVEKNVEKHEPEYWALKHPYPMPKNFTGRIAERAMLTHWLKEDPENHLFILRALGGFGKSALAWQWITHDVDIKEYPKVLWWSFYEGDARFEHFIEETLKYLNLEIPQGQRPQMDELLKAMQGQNILLIMDGFERALRAYSSMNAAYQGDDAPAVVLGGEDAAGSNSQLDCVNINAEIFLKSVCSLPNIKSKVLMTTRLTPRAVKPRGEFMLGCHEEELTAMQPADAVEFFHKQQITGTHAEIEAARAPYGYHPLSLRLLAGRILKDFENPADILVAQKLKIDGDIVQQKHHVLEVSYNSLPSHEQKLLSTIACFRSPVELTALQSIAENKNSLNDDLHDLVERGLLHFDEKNKKFDLHPIVRRYAYVRLSDKDKKGAHERLVNYFEAFPKPEKVKTQEDLGPIIELYHHMVRAGRLDEAFVLFRDRLHEQMYFQFGAYQTYAELLLTLFFAGEDQPPRLKKDDDQAWILSALGNVYSLSGQPRRAVLLFEMSKALHEKAGNKRNLAIELGNMAIMAQLPVGALRQAELNVRRGIEFNIEIQGNKWEAENRRILAILLCYSTKWEEAEKELSEAISLFEKINQVQGQGMVCAYRAQCFLLMARESATLDIRHSKVEARISKSAHLLLAIESAGHALELADENARTIPRDYVRAYWLLGAAYRMNNELDKAEENLSKAISMCRQINLVADEADILLHLARLRYDQKNFEEAKSIADEALSITERCGYVLQGADVNLFLAQYALEQEQDKARAKEYALEAKKLATCDGPPYYYKVAYEEAERFLENLK